MNHGYEVYCLADPHFYDSPTRTRGDDVDFALATRPVPSGWERAELDDWLVYRPHGLTFPPQGWKIHVSACLDNAEEILTIAFDHCVGREVAFKFIRSLQLLFMRNVKYADRGASGKFVTIYPRNEAELEGILTDLGSTLEGQAGPYILSDLRWGSGPLYVRYGGFTERYCVGSTGQLELAIADPDGNLVVDRRSPTFYVPEWVELPHCLEPHLAARNATTVDELAYDIEEALHFSNGGGLYRATDKRTGERVVLKEARPHAGLAADRADAVARLDREATVLEQLAGLDVVPALHDRFTIGDHHFLALEYIDGSPLSALLVERYPLAMQEIDEDAVAAYTSWALDMQARVERAVAAIHDRGIVIGDLHPYNMIVGEADRVVLIDYEVAAGIAEGRRPTLGDPGFAAPSDRTGFEIDNYALACLRLFLFLPLTSLLALDKDKAAELAREIAVLFPVPAEFLAEAVATIAGPVASSTGGRRTELRPDADGWDDARFSMATALALSATLGRDDRLFPGDVSQFETGGLNVAHGAAGVLYAMAATDAGRRPAWEDWLIQRALYPAQGSRVGFYDGLHGVAHVLDYLGYQREAIKVLEICVDEVNGRYDRLGTDLHSGLAGVGLNLLHFAGVADEPALWAEALNVADAVAGQLGAEDDVAETSGGDLPYAGLLRGSSGPALLFIRLFERTGDSTFLDLAHTALSQDLRRCYLRPEGSLEVNEGWRTMPYLADGSVGIGCVLDDYLAHRDDERLADAAASIRRAAEGILYIEPGLFHGRAGMILYLSRKLPAGAAAADPLIQAHVRRLGWHALTYRDHLAFPGEQLLRLSMDLATGTAGVLLAMGAALHEHPVHLPFLSS